jgi:hypothetical protein
MKTRNGRKRAACGHRRILAPIEAVAQVSGRNDPDFCSKRPLASLDRLRSRKNLAEIDAARNSEAQIRIDRNSFVPTPHENVTGPSRRSNRTSAVNNLGGHVGAAVRRYQNREDKLWRRYRFIRPSMMV